MPIRVTRRRALKLTAAGTLGHFLTAPAASAMSVRGANDKIRVAGIGVGGKGSGDIEQAGKLMTVVALCDIDDVRLAKRAATWPSARTFTDYRKLFDEVAKDIDAVTVSTADHSHAPAAVRAMLLGKHVYCQKPLTHTVQEARLMRETAAKYGVATQMGNQGTAENGLRQAVEVIQSGAIGPVREAHVWTNRPIWPQAPAVTKRPDGEDPIPASIHWDEWIGTAPMRPYKTKIYHPFAWRGWWDFGTGALGDMACHTANMAFMALKLGYPTSVVAENDPINPETYPGWAKITFQFPARGEMPPVKFVWYEGKNNGQKLLPSAELLKGQRASDSGSLLVGEKGTLYSPNDYGAEYLLLPKENFEGYKPPEPKLPRNGKEDLGMKIEWVEAIKGGPPAMSNFNYAGMLTETILLGNVAMRAGKLLEWDGPNMRFTNAPEANAFLKIEPRKGWTL